MEIKQRLIDDIRELTKKLSDKTNIYDADTLLKDAVERADFEVNGLAYEIFDIWEKSNDKESIEQVFYNLTDMEFIDFLRRCEEIMYEQTQEFDQELADFIKEKVREIQWLEDPDCIDERDLDDVIDCLKDSFEDTRWCEGYEDYDYWWDEFSEKIARYYFMRMF